MGVWTDPDTIVKRAHALAFEDCEQSRTRSASIPKRGNDEHERKGYSKSRNTPVSAGTTSDYATSGEHTSSAPAEARSGRLAVVDNLPSDSSELTGGNARHSEPSESSCNRRSDDHTTCSLDDGSLVHVMHEPMPLGTRALFKEAYMPPVVPRLCRLSGFERALGRLRYCIGTTYAA